MQSDCKAEIRGPVLLTAVLKLVGVIGFAAQ
jgi:hypothetical protein